jgi:membrane fusion protein, multidrug efflux system
VPDVKDEKTVRPESEVSDPDVHGPWPEEEEHPKAGKGRSYLKEHPGVRIALVAAVIVVILGGIFVWRYYAARESTDDAQVDGHITPISARVSGTVISVNFNDNQFVKAGDTIVQLDPRDYEVAKDRAAADLADAQATAQAAQTSIPISNINTASQLQTAEAQLIAAQRESDAARARVREAQANYDRVSKDLERFKQLISKDEISRQQYDAAVSQEAGARATLDASNSAVATAESHIAQAQAGVRQAATAPQQVSVTRSRAGSAAALAQKQQAALAIADLNLQYTTVKAPANGIVSKRSVEVGQVIQPGQPLCALVNLDDIYVTANFKETQLKEMKVGQAVSIKVDAYDNELKGHIDSIGGATGARFSLLPPENATGNYVKVVQRIPVKIVFEPGQDPDKKLRPGMSVTPTVITK